MNRLSCMRSVVVPVEYFRINSSGGIVCFLCINASDINNNSMVTIK